MPKISSLLSYTATSSPTPQNWGTVKEVGVLFLTPSIQAYILIGLLKKGICYLIHLLIKSIEFRRSPDRESVKHVPNIHIGHITGKHLPRATESMPSTLLRDGRRGSEGWCHQAEHSGLMTHLASLFPDAQPTSAWGTTGKIPHLPHWNQVPHNLNPQGTPGSRKA